MAFDIETAIAETLLRGAGRRTPAAPQRLFRHQLEEQSLSVIRCLEMSVARLHGLGLIRLGIDRSALIDGPEAAYPDTARWAQALYDAPLGLQGLCWTSRQNDSARALMLWGDRVPTGALTLASGPLPLHDGPGLELVVGTCLLAGVTLEY